MVGLVAFLAFTKTAVLDTTVSIASRPAARMVSPDSTRHVSILHSLDQCNISLTDKIHDALSNLERASRFHTSAKFLDRSLDGRAWRNTLKIAEELLCESSEAGDHCLADKVLGLLQLSVLGNLDLKLAGAEFEIKDLFNLGNLASGKLGIVFSDLVTAGDTDINAAFAHKGRNVGGGEEDKRNWVVLDQRDVKAGLAVELNIATGEQVKGGLVEASL
jgi:hypothetical protein